MQLVDKPEILAAPSPVSPIRGRLPLLPVVGIAYLSLLCVNLWLAPRNDLVWATFEAFDVTGRAVVLIVGLGYLVGSVGIVALFWRRQWRRSADLLKDLRDGAWVISILSAGSLIPTGFVALMRGDSAASGPLVNGSAIVVITVSVLALAVLLTIASAARRENAPIEGS